MVQNLARFERKMGRLPRLIKRAAVQSFENSADKITATMRMFAEQSRQSGALIQSIGWVWGADLPKGAVSVGTVGQPSDSEFFITVYAGSEAAFYALWVEFGTDAHSLARNASVERGARQSQGVQHPGARPSPFFYPSYRLHRRSVRGAFAREVNRELKKLQRTGA